MKPKLAKITLDQWDARYEELKSAGLAEPFYGGPLRRHVLDGDLRLADLKFDDSPAALRLWNFLLSEEDRLFSARDGGKKIVGAMKDLGTVPVMALGLPNVVAFYPDGAWWIPCVMRLGDELLGIAQSMGAGESFCPVRAMLAAFATEGHFPIPDLLTCSVGATCDDFSAIAQRLTDFRQSILWWEIPARRVPQVGEEAVDLPGGLTAPVSQVRFVREELERVRRAIEDMAGAKLDDAALADGIAKANGIRRLLDELRYKAYTTTPCPMPAIEMLVAEMLAIHFCSDRQECQAVLEELLAEVNRRIAAGLGVQKADAAGIFVVNPPADLRLMNLLEDCGGRVCGSDYMFGHALDEIPPDVEPMEALARTALADPMAGPAGQRADRILRDAEAFGAEAVLICRIPGASHCATEGAVIAGAVEASASLPVVEIEVPPLIDSVRPNIQTRIEALVETARRARRRRK
ncbi:MAG: 2-hydroxyacyl-CoA dehydratase [Planctomycetes bacterium]|nr:2-hydroxyacyl-CoA dehydratase [Planctomycetota bacterium]